MKTPTPLQKTGDFSNETVFGEMYSREGKPFIRIRPAYRPGQLSLLKPPQYTLVHDDAVEIEFTYDLEIKQASPWNPLIFNDFIIRCHNSAGFRREFSHWQNTVKTSLALKANARIQSARRMEFYVRIRFQGGDLKQRNLPLRLQPVLGFEYYHNRKSDFVRISLELQEILLHEEPYILKIPALKKRGFLI
ncbi:hypothetical protein JW933_03165 [candidate division FCPU426 bacterium]|nr:hypothetical protein [candidate division FCPU426 bacterium]